MDILSFALQIVAIGFTRLVARNYPQSFDEKNYGQILFLSAWYDH